MTYPSLYEGFGNAFLEAVYFGKPVVVNSYAVYARDIDPLGFKTVEIPQLVTWDVVDQVRTLLGDRGLREDWARTNYQLGAPVLLACRGAAEARGAFVQPVRRRGLRAAGTGRRSGRP